MPLQPSIKGVNSPEKVLGDGEVLLQDDDVLGLGVDLEGGPEGGVVVLADPRIPLADRRVLDAAEAEQLGHGQRLRVEAVYEDGDLR